MRKPVRIRYADGAEYVVTDAAAAARVHPAAEIVAYEDGSPFSQPVARRSGKAGATRTSATKPTVTPEVETDGPDD